MYDNPNAIANLAPDAVLLPQHFKAAGYRTLGAGKVFHNRRSDLFDSSSFEQQNYSPFARNEVDYTEDELPSKGTEDPRHVVDRGPGVEPVVLPLNRLPSFCPDSPTAETFDWGGVDAMDGEMRDTEVTTWAVEVLREESDEPFFLAVGLFRPHVPWFVPQKYFDLYPVESIELPPTVEGDFDDLGPEAHRFRLNRGREDLHGLVLQHDLWKPTVASYLACISYADEQVGRLLDALDEGPHADNTLVVLWSDHGYDVGEKQDWGKWAGWDPATRVPLAIVPPRRANDGFRTDAICRQPVSLLDLYPTVNELCGLAPRAELDGESLVPLLRDPSAARDRAIVTSLGSDQVSVRTFGWRWIRYGAEGSGEEELYDLAADPLEWTNLAGLSEFEDVQAALAACASSAPNASECPLPARTAGNTEDDTFVVRAGAASHELRVLRNDTGSTLDAALRVVSVTQPVEGCVALAEDGSGVLFDPETALTEQQFDYTTEEAGGARKTASVRVRIDVPILDPARVPPADQSGILSREAETFSGLRPRGGHEWVETTPLDPSGPAALQGVPQDSTKFLANHSTVSPRVDYRLTVDVPGTYYLWLRGATPGATPRSVYFGLDGIEYADATVSFGPPDGPAKGVLHWRGATGSEAVGGGSRATIDFATSGIHYLNLWIREAGVIVDKLLLTQDELFVPTGKGPEATVADAGPTFMRGDCNGDGGAPDVTDAIFLLGFNFTGGMPAPCLAACDADSDGAVLGLVTDAVYLLTFKFLGGPAPESPFPKCGPGLASDRRLGCELVPGACPE